MSVVDWIKLGILAICAISFTYASRHFKDILLLGLHLEDEDHTMTITQHALRVIISLAISIGTLLLIPYIL